ncbi:restriction endonuclease subunit S [Alkalimarinus coralli]|uniref:restriction endonuclease subunit S n=1 Tax=Alkalimarinus coralli TaxID=2935863 RepID=UPI00202B7B3F|nr:restriction endonuclease subunit S [Alkalimarinus coralli]
MSCNWPTVKLGDYCNKIGSGATPRGGASVYMDEGEICLIRSQNVYNEGFNPNGLVYIDEEAAKKLKNVTVEENDVLLNITGDSVARVCLAKSNFLPARVNQHVAIIRPDEKEFDSRFIRYLLASPAYQNILLSIAAVGATRNALTKGMIENLDVVKPPIEQQIEIADKLEALENKIDINSETNQTLEQIAQALFKSWFVDFDPIKEKIAVLEAGGTAEEAELAAMSMIAAKSSEQLAELKQSKPDAYEQLAQTAALFPSAMQESELGDIPKGWTEKPLGSLIDFMTGFAFKSKQFSDSGVRLARGDNVKEGKFYWGDKSRFWPSISAEIEKYQLKSGDILIGMDGSKVGKNWVRVNSSDLPCLLVQRVARLRENGQIGSSMLEVIVGGNSFKRYVDNVKTGTSIPHISGKQIKDMPVLCPDDGGSLFQEFERLLSPLAERKGNNISENLTLQGMRDTLLPKLISGELERG